MIYFFLKNICIHKTYNFMYDYVKIWDKNYFTEYKAKPITFVALPTL